MQSPAITIVIPFYRGADYLYKAISSVQLQTCPDWELWILDDGGFEPKVSCYIESLQDGRIHYRRNPTNLGMAGNWNQAFAVGSAPWVHILHADDELEPHYMERMLLYTQQQPQVACWYCFARIIDSNSQPTSTLVDRFKSWLQPKENRILQYEAGLMLLMRGNFIVCPTLFYNRQIGQEYPFDPRWKFILDWEWTTRLLFAGEAIGQVPEYLLRYRRHEDNATERYSASLLRYQEEFTFLNQRARECAERGWHKASRVAKRKLAVRLHLLFRIGLDCMRLQLKAAIQKITFLLGFRAEGARVR